MASNEHEEKQKFVKLWVKDPENPFAAALQLFPNNTPRALWVASNWPVDPEALDIKNDIENGDDLDSLLAGKVELARDVWLRMKAARYDEDYVKLAKLYAEIRGFIEKANPNQNNTQIIAQKVIQVTNFGSNDDWEKAAVSQQRELLNVSRSRN
jgi:hypothetical protein